MRANVWHPNSTVGPEEIRTVELSVLRIDPAGVHLQDVYVQDVGSGPLFEKPDLQFDHAFGGGPLVSPRDTAAARAFGVVNTAYHLDRGLKAVAGWLGHGLPPLVARIGMHVEGVNGWGGGHYRLPAQEYSTLPEETPPVPDGEIHLGLGARYLPYGNTRYYNAPAHMMSIVYHELGHHLCRHTADFRLNERRSPLEQGNRKIPLAEGTCDFLTAILMGTPDIFGWHRAEYPATHQRRRHLDAGWTMRDFRGSCKHDPHTDGTIWSNALWSARVAVTAEGVAPDVFDRLVVRALERIGQWDDDVPWDEALRRRRQFSVALQAILYQDTDDGSGCGKSIEASFARSGIRLGQSNSQLRERARTSALVAAS